MSGLFVVFEGIDGSGKSTQIQQVSKILETQHALKTFCTREPSDGPFGKKIREKSYQEAPLSPEEELQLYLEDRRWHLQEMVLPALARGEIVLQDRYYLSTIAYQGSKKFAPEELRQKNLEFIHPADLTLFFDIAPEKALERIRKGRTALTQYEKLDYLKQVYALYQQEKALIPGVISLKAEQSPEDLSQEIVSLILAKRPN